eukprot:635477-Rhodomonas_salina.1
MQPAMPSLTLRRRCPRHRPCRSHSHAIQRSASVYGRVAAIYGGDFAIHEAGSFLPTRQRLLDAVPSSHARLKLHALPPRPSLLSVFPQPVMVCRRPSALCSRLLSPLLLPVFCVALSAFILMPTALCSCRSWSLASLRRRRRSYRLDHQARTPVGWIPMGIMITDAKE